MTAQKEQYGYISLVALFDKYIQKHHPTFDNAQMNSANELRRRIVHLSYVAPALMEINHKLLEKMQPQITMLVEDGFIVAHTPDGQKVKLLAVSGNTQLEMLGGASGYIAGADQEEDEETSFLRINLELMCEIYYNGAHKIINLAFSKLGFNSMSDIAAFKIRNSLIEHAADHHAYSFSCSTAGPSIKPARGANETDKKGNPLIYDQGFLHNQEEFIKTLEERINQKLTT